MPKVWTLRRATNVGVPAGVALLVTWPLQTSYPEWLDVPTNVLLAIAGFCGLSIILMTVADIVRHRRSSMMTPIRTLDILLGLLLTAPALLRLDSILQG